MRFRNNLRFYKNVIFQPVLQMHKNIHFHLIRSDHTIKYRHNFYVSSFTKYFSEKFHVSAFLYVKSFQEKENEFAHSIMENIPAYVGSLLKQPLEVDSFKYPKELKDFEKVTIESISKNISLENTQFSSMVLDICKMIPNMSNENLIKCLYLLCCWPPSPKTWTPNFKLLWNTLDLECVKRLSMWDIDRMLFVADHWFHLRLNRITQYNRTMIMNNLQNLNHMTDTQVVQLMFYINLQREIPPHLLFALEKRLLPVIETVSIDELGVICLGFFKTKNKISDISIINAIITRFLKNINDAKLPTIVSLLKFLKKSMQLPYTELYIPLLHAGVQCIAKWDVTTSVHLALLASECHVYHPLLFDTVTNKVVEEIETARLKDCMKLLQCLAHFNHLPRADLSELLFSEIPKESRKLEISTHPRNLVYIALYYAYLGVYNYDFLNEILNENFVERCSSLFPETNLTFAEVDCCIEIECKDYKGHRLNRRKWKVLCSRRSNLATTKEKPNALNRLMNEISISLEDLLGSKDKILIKHILPHVFLPDIIVQLSDNANNLPSTSNDILIPPPNDIWICIVLGVPFSFAYRSKIITGVTAMKLRQLEKIGYKTVFIPYYELPRNSIERKQYIKKQIDVLNFSLDTKLTKKF